ncbi:BatA domain-containing protein [Massilia sp. S19_KUP03_FR1]|uniref:BatA domain-containing protein n=1 Tax=Massilia sp. S19_KUP03_FR1 TaxID=3025503 RepID=UPI002FCDBCEE
MTSLWWWALPVLLLPVWWHRQRRRQVQATPLATARFLPKSAPRQLRAWRWVDLMLLVLRCLLLATLIAWLADPVVAWRADTVLVLPGGVSKDPRAVALPTQDAIGWFRAREAEWKPDAKITIVGPQTMAATQPRLRHLITLQTVTPPVALAKRHVAIFSATTAPWRALLSAVDGPVRYVVDAAPDAQTEWIVWDETDVAPPAGPWRVVRTALPLDAAAARALLETWQHQYVAPVPYVAPPQVLAADPSVPVKSQGGALRDKLLIALIALFALERGLAHVRKR